MELPILVVPGWTNAGPEHWQTLWQRENPDWIRVEQADWETPQPQDWLATLEQSVQACEAPPLLIGHSLGCIAIAQWALISHAEVAGAFLVAPADVASVNALAEVKPFAPVPKAAMPFPTHIGQR